MKVVIIVSKMLTRAITTSSMQV